MNKRDIIQGTVHRFRDGKLQEAYDFVTKHSSSIEPDTGIFNFRFALASQLNQIELSMDILKEAVETHNFWYHPEYLETRESLENLRKHKEFKKLLNINKERFNENKYPEPYMEVSSVQSDQLLFAVHSDYQSIWNLKDCINNVTFPNHTIIYPRATEQTHHDAFKWREPEITYALLKDYFEDAVQSRNIKKKDTTLYGFDSASHIILDSLIKGFIDTNKIIFDAPSFLEYDTFKTSFNKLKDKNLKIYIITSNSDEEELKTHKMYQKDLQKNNVYVNLHILDGVTDLQEKHMIDLYSEIKEFFSFH